MSPYEAVRTGFFALSTRTSDSEDGTSPRTASRQRRLMAFLSTASAAIFFDTVQLYLAFPEIAAYDREKNAPCTCRIRGTLSVLLRRLAPLLTRKASRGPCGDGAGGRDGRFWSWYESGIRAFGRACAFLADMFASWISFWRVPSEERIPLHERENNSRDFP